MRFCYLTLLVLSCSGCVMGIPDADPPVKPPRLCQVVVIQEPDHAAVCMSRAEFERAMKGVLY